MQPHDFKIHSSVSCFLWQKPGSKVLNSVISTFLVIVILLFSTSLISLATETEQIRQEEKRKLKLDISKHQINIQRLDRGLRSQKEGVQNTLLKEKGILAEIEEIDIRLNKTLTRLNDLQRRMREQQQLISNKESRLAAVRDKRQRVQDHLQKRMAAYYKLGKIDIINITFSTQTFPELLKFHDSFKSVLIYDQGVIADYRDTITELEGVTEALTLERGLLEEFIFQANEEQRVIKETRLEQEQLLVRIKNQSHLHRQAIKEIEKAQDELTTSLLALKVKDELIDQGFLINKNKHILPLDGIIINLFNQERINKFGIERQTPGISFEAPDGTKIRAIYNGTVIFAGYLRGYGNTVILDHGYQYFTIISRIERIVVTKGSSLNSGDIIGIMGVTATLMDDGLYFEIRHKENSLDPLEWLNPGLLTFKEGLKQ